MASQMECSSNSTDEEEVSGEDDESKTEDSIGRRRRFIIERNNERSMETSAFAEPKPKRAHINYDEQVQHKIGRIDCDRRSGRRRRHQRNDQRYQPQQQHQCFANNSNLRQIPLVNDLTTTTTIIIKKKELPAQQSSKDPVVYINPKFIKKFIMKTIELANLSKNTGSQIDANNATVSGGSSGSRPTTRRSATPNNESNSMMMIDQIDFKTSPREALQAASTMAIIRLVTECIEDDSKRDEKLNKTLVSRLIDDLSAR